MCSSCGEHFPRIFLDKSLGSDSYRRLTVSAKDSEMMQGQVNQLRDSLEQLTKENEVCPSSSCPRFLLYPLSLVHRTPRFVQRTRPFL